MTALLDRARAAREALDAIEAAAASAVVSRLAEAELLARLGRAVGELRTLAAEIRLAQKEG